MQIHGYHCTKRISATFSQWIGSGVSVHTFLYHAGFKSVQLEQFPFLPFQRQLGFLRYGFIGTAQTMALYLSDAIHSDPSSDPVERQKYRMAVTYLQLPDLGVYGKLQGLKLRKHRLHRAPVV